MLTREDILKISDIVIEEVKIPEWNGTVYVKSMSGVERDAFEATIVSQRGKDPKVNMANIRAKLTAQTCCDKDGKLLFSASDIVTLGKKNASALQRIFNVAQRLSGISAKDVDELAEELDKDPSDGSASD